MIDGPNSCASCGQTRCALNQEARLEGLPATEIALVLGCDRPEFQAWLTPWMARAAQVFVPWQRKGMARGGTVCRPIWPAIRRSLRLRLIGLQGGVRQAVLERFDERQAAVVAARLRPAVRHLVIAQEFLPFLHASRSLGGRSYDVLLHRLPRRRLQSVLDEALAREPALASLADFRSVRGLVAAEEDALAGARHVVTANLHLAQLFPDQAIIVPQARYPTMSFSAGRRVAFLGPTLARRGAGIVRSIMAELDERLVVIGPNLEGEAFWASNSVEGRVAGPAQFDGVGLLLAPAFTDSDPRHLHQALARGIEVVAPPVCGLAPRPDLHLVDPFDRDAIVSIIRDFTSRRASMT